MTRSLLTCFVAIGISLLSNHAFGSIDIRFSNVDGGLGDLLDIDSLDFGSAGTVPEALFATNINDTDSSATLSVGDAVTIVGNVLLPEASASGAELTAIIQITGTLYDAGTSSLIGLGIDIGGGSIDFYVDAPGAVAGAGFTTFDPTDATTGGDGILAAAFDIQGIASILLPTIPSPSGPIPSGLASSTFLDANLVSNPYDLFTLPGGTSLGAFGLDLFLGATTDETSTSLTLSGIGGGSDPAYIGTDFTPGTPFDVFLESTGTISFAVVPEPTSALVWCGLASMLGLARTRRRS